VEDRYVARPAGTVTFNRDIAPIFYKECATCHRPGQAGPFDLITYTDAKKRAGQIGEVTQSRFMPPWLPEHGIQPLADERRLNAEQVGLIQQWVPVPYPTNPILIFRPPFRLLGALGLRRVGCVTPSSA
jgi:hypothetical protein